MNTMKEKNKLTEEYYLSLLDLTMSKLKNLKVYLLKNYVF